MRELSEEQIYDSFIKQATLTVDFYGSCNLCDTLLGIYENSNGIDMIKKDLATMVLHVIQSMQEQLDNK